MVPFFKYGYVLGSVSVFVSRAFMASLLYRGKGLSGPDLVSFLDHASRSI